MIDVEIAYVLVAIILLLAGFLLLYRHYFLVMHEELLKLVCDMEYEPKFFELPSYDGVYDQDIFNSDISEDKVQRYIEFKTQYEKYGFDDTVTWSLDYCLAKWLVPRLERFVEIASDAIKISDEMFEIYQEMIDGFKLILGDNDLGDEQRKKVNKSFELLSKHYDSLWW